MSQNKQYQHGWYKGIFYMCYIQHKCVYLVYISGISDSDSEIIYSDKDYIEWNIIKKNVLMCLGDFC